MKKETLYIYAVNHVVIFLKREDSVHRNEVLLSTELHFQMRFSCTFPFIAFEKKI